MAVRVREFETADRIKKVWLPSTTAGRSKRASRVARIDLRADYNATRLVVLAVSHDSKPEATGLPNSRLDRMTRMNNIQIVIVWFFSWGCEPCGHLRIEKEGGNSKIARIARFHVDTTWRGIQGFKARRMRQL